MSWPRIIWSFPPLNRKMIESFQDLQTNESIGLLRFLVLRIINISVEALLSILQKTSKRISLLSHQFVQYHLQQHALFLFPGWNKNTWIKGGWSQLCKKHRALVWSPVPGYPDLTASDGVYSAYVPSYAASPGYYGARLRVGDNHGRAAVPKGQTKGEI